MLKITGICMIIAGATLFIFTLYKGRREGIRGDMNELTMILSSGYVSERAAEERSTSPFEGRTPITPAPKKKRVLSEEARSILEMVERGRENEAAQIEAAQDLRSSEERTGKPEALPLYEDAKKGTAVLPEEHRKGTAILPRQEVPPEKRKGTAILPENAKKGTAVLPKQELPAPERKGTAVLLENDIARGTAVLTEVDSQKKGTAVLTEETNIDEEAMPHARKGTAVLTEKGD